MKEEKVPRLNAMIKLVIGLIIYLWTVNLWWGALKYYHGVKSGIELYFIPFLLFPAIIFFASGVSVAILNKSDRINLYICLSYVIILFVGMHSVLFERYNLEIITGILLIVFLITIAVVIARSLYCLKHSFLAKLIIVFPILVTMGIIIYFALLFNGGVLRRYYEKGQLYSENSYKNFKLNGISRIYYPDGTLRDETNYKDGKKEGASWEYFQTEKYRCDRIFKDGEFQSCKCIADSGELLRESEGNIDKEYYKSGKLKKEDRTYWDRNKNRIRIFKEYYNSGALMSEYNDEKGYSRGYYENGQLKYESIKKGNVIEYREFYENGNRRVEVITKDGKIISRTRYGEGGHPL